MLPRRLQGEVLQVPRGRGRERGVRFEGERFEGGCCCGEEGLRETQDADVGDVRREGGGTNGGEVVSVGGQCWGDEEVGGYD